MIAIAGKRGMLFLAAALGLWSCGNAANLGTAAPEDAASVAAPLSGVDLPDRSCRVVLRDAGRAIGPTGVQTECVDGKCWFVFAASVDVDALTWTPRREVGLLFRTSLDGTWREAEGTRAEGVRNGFVRYDFRLAEHTLAEGLSATTLSQAQLDMIPFVRTQGGERLFDHNRHPGALDNYVLSAGNGFSVASDGLTCTGASSPRSTVQFRSDYGHGMRGALVRGGRLVVEYALDRMTQCMGSTYQGYATWNTQAFVRFSPGGQQYVGDVKGFSDLHGQQWYPQPFEVDVPNDAEQVELWFEHTGLRCTTQYDSRVGRNYRFAVEGQALPAVEWAGRWTSSLLQGSCEAPDAIDEVEQVSEAMLSGACAFIEASVYVPGVTDLGHSPHRVLGEVEYQLDSGPLTVAPLTFGGLEGNDFRFQWQLPDEVRAASWSTLDYAFRFSTDGTRWFRVGREGGPVGGGRRTLLR